jgi:LacI family transcriptional regulator
VALLVQMTSEWHRQLLRGVADYAREHGPWDFHIEPRGLLETMQLPEGWHGDGVILRLVDRTQERAIRRRGLPAVNVSWQGENSRVIPRVSSDESACARLAASHFVEKGFRSFAYVGPAGHPEYADVLGAEFAKATRAAGFECVSFLGKPTQRRRPMHRQRKRLARWLQGLPQPTAVLVWNGEVGREVIAACSTHKLPVPDDVAVLCAEHDSVMNTLAPVPMSNIDQSPLRVGREAATLLDRLMAGRRPPDHPIHVPPVGVVQRQSTDTTAVNDPLVAAALRHIRSHSYGPLKVSDLQKALFVSRRTLEHRFTQSLGHTPAAEIRRTRLEHVRNLLIETDHPLAIIAERTGYQHLEVMVRAFQRQFGSPPGRFRRER